MNRTDACAWFGNTTSNGFPGPCPYGPDKAVCVAVWWGANVTPWYCGESAVSEYTGGAYGYTIVGSYLPYQDSWLYAATNWWASAVRNSGDPFLLDALARSR